MTALSHITCHSCKTPNSMGVHLTLHKFSPNGKVVEVETTSLKCSVCEAITTTNEQHNENLKRLAARKSEYGCTLMGEEYVALRKRYGLNQKIAARIFGKGKIAFSRYENEASYPDNSTRLLIELAIENPTVLKSLADKADVSIPLWAERLEDLEHTES